VMRGLRSAQPMLDPRLFRLRGFGTGSLSISVQFFAAFGFLFIALQYLQFVAGLSPLTSALALLPLPAVLLPLARRAPAIAQRFGLNRVGALGLTLIAAGLGVISFVGVEFHYWIFAAGVVVFGVGMALAGAPATTAIVSSLPREKQGVASAVNDVSREFGSALGIALLGSVLNDRYRSGVSPAVAGLPAPIAQHAESSLAFVQQAPLQRFGAAATHLLAVAQQAFVDAASTSLRVAAAILVCAAVYVVVRGPRRSEAASEIRGGTLGAAAEPAYADGNR
jgi:Na+/melibiose symporter-like transporter